MTYVEKVTMLIDALDQGINVDYVPGGSKSPFDNNMLLELHRYLRYTVEHASDDIKIAIDEMMQQHFPGDYKVLDAKPKKTKQEMLQEILEAIEAGLYIYNDYIVDEPFVHLHKQFPDLLDELDVVDEVRLDNLYDNIEPAKERKKEREAYLLNIETLKKADYDRRVEIYDAVPRIVLNWDETDFGSLNLFELERYVSQIRRDIFKEQRPAVQSYLERVVKLRKDVWGNHTYDPKTKEIR